jgi:hypothetical protein
LLDARLELAMEAGTKGLGAALAVGAAIAFIWGMIRYQIVYNTLRDNFLPQFKDNLTERYAFPVLVLYPPTPPSLQIDYVKALIAVCIGFFCASLSFFCFGQAPLGCLCLLAFFMNVFSVIKAWKAYRENCNRQGNGEEA